MTRPFRDFDGHSKATLHASPHDFVRWLRPEAGFRGFLSTEHKLVTDFDTDGILLIEEDGKRALMDIEFQSVKHEYMGARLTLYNELASQQHEYLPCWSYLINQLKVTDGLQSPYIVRMPSGVEIKRLNFTRIDLWDIQASELRNLKLDGLLPLLPLTKESQEKRRIMEEVAADLAARKQSTLLSLNKAFAGFAYTGQTEQAWLERIYAVGKDILKESWVVQEWMKEGREEGIKEGREEGIKEGREEGTVQAQRRILLAIVQARFPKQVPLAHKLSQDVKDPDLFQQVIVNVSLAQDEQTVRLALIELIH